MLESEFNFEFGSVGVPEIDGVVFSLLLLLLVYFAVFEAAESLEKQAVFESFGLDREFKSVVESLLRLAKSLVISMSVSLRKSTLGSVGKVCPDALRSGDVPERLEVL